MGQDEETEGKEREGDGDERGREVLPTALCPNKN